MEDDATCSLCMEVFTDPVSLPCGHGFCRGCLRSVVDHNSGVKTRDDIPSDSAILTCPLCRTDVTLGPRRVDELQPNQHLLDLMNLRCEVKDEVVTAPSCDVCESDNRQADHYCKICMILYCEQCLSALHPPRGPLGRHPLMSMEQYLPQKSSHEANLETSLGEPDKKVACCKEHNQTLNLYCGTCERPICVGCVSGHNDHIMQDIVTAHIRNKPSMEDQVSRCRALRTELQKLQTELVATQKDVQTKTSQEYEKIEENYKSCLKSLKDWRKSERDKVEDKRDKLTNESLSTLKRINLLIEEFDRLVTTYEELLSGNEALFLLESKELLVRLQRHSTESGEETDGARRKTTELRSALSRCNFSPCAVIIQAPQLKFTESTSSDRVFIDEDGMVVKDDPEKPALDIGVRTDGLISQTRYWEVEVTWGLTSPPPKPDIWRPVCTVGVRREGTDFTSCPGYDTNSYGVELVYQQETNSYRYDCVFQKEDGFQSKRKVLQDESVPHRFGFLFKLSDRTLTVIDLKAETRLHTFRELDVTRPLVPVVWFDDYMYISGRSIRLLPVERSSQLERLFDII